MQTLEIGTEVKVIYRARQDKPTIGTIGIIDKVETMLDAIAYRINVNGQLHWLAAHHVKNNN